MKRHLPGTVLLLFLLVNLSPSFAKEAPDCGYLWYVEEGKLLYDQEYRYTGYSGTGFTSPTIRESAMWSCRSSIRPPGKTGRIIVT